MQQRHGGQREVLLTEPIKLALREVQGGGHPPYVPALGQGFLEQQLQAQGQPLAATLPLPLLQQAAQVETELLHQERTEQRVLMALLLRIEVLNGTKQGPLLGGTAQTRAARKGIPGGALVQQQPHQIPISPSRRLRLLRRWPLRLR
ncbi:hypothetical protein D3C75_679460 [compost metagenome]